MERDNGSMSKGMIINILKRSIFSAEFIAYLDSNFPPNYKKRFDKPYHMDYLENPIMDLEPKKRLIESLAQLVPLKEYYINKGIPLIHLYKSIYDLSYRLERYYKDHGGYGLDDRDVQWLSSLYKGEIFDLGSLRFQISGFSNKEIERTDYQYMPLGQKWKEKFPEGTPVITLHILKDTDFRPEKIEESFHMARDFFEQYFKEHEYKIFICRTWLLYGPTRDILGEDSNIASFSKRFQIIAENQNTKQALDRIYGTSDLEVIKQMDKNSSLAQVAYKNLDKLGVAAGIIYK